MSQYLLMFVTGLGVSLLLTPVARALACRWAVLDCPGERRVHRYPTPLLGGVAVWAGFTVPVVAFCRLSSPVVGLLAGGFVILLLGIVDDVVGLKAWQKLLGQIAASLVLVGFGGRIEFLTNPFGGMIYLSHFAIPLTILWMVALTNVVNFMDGIDGLAAGISGIACLTVFSVAVMNRQPYVAPLAVILAGSAFGFLRYNLHPATVFLGDAGALFLGYTIAGISVIGAVKGATTLALGIPAAALALPILDTAFVIAGRISHGAPFYKADNRHLHHRLLDLGLDQKQAAGYMYKISLLLAVGALVLSRSPFLVLAVAAAIGLITLARGIYAVRSSDAGGQRTPKQF